MTTISATASSLGEALVQLISGGSNGPLAGVGADTGSTSSSPAPSSGGAGPATIISLSDQAQAAAAQKAQSDQAAADSLQAYVEAHRIASGSSNSAESLFDQTTSLSNAPPSSSGSKVAAIVAQIKAAASANEPPPFQSFTPTKSLSSSVTFDGYTLTVDTNASTQFFGFELSGNGTDIADKHFGAQDGAIVGGPFNGSISTAEVNNNEALEAVTITQNVATASASTVSSSAGSISTSSVNAQSSSMTFLINYATGAISVAHTEASVSAQAARGSPPGSALSTLA